MTFVEEYKGFRILSGNRIFLVAENWDYEQIPFATVEAARAWIDENGKAIRELSAKVNAHAALSIIE